MHTREQSTSSAGPRQAVTPTAAPPAIAQERGNAFAQEQLPAEEAAGGILIPMLAPPEQGGEGGGPSPTVGPEQAEGGGEAPAEEPDAGLAGHVSPELAEAFNAEFAPVRHALGGTGDGGVLTPTDLESLFTDDQLAKIEGFIASHTVPPRLFNGVRSPSALTPQRRILLSSHILANGTFDPASVLEEGGPPEVEHTDEDAPSEGAPATPSEGAPAAPGEGGGAPAVAEEEEAEASGGQREIAANSCRHWAMMVYAYAGVGVPGEGAEGLWHTHDPTGGIVMAAAPPEETRGSYGTGESMRAGRSGRWAPFFGPGIQAANVFHPGDWLQLSWGSGGGHSVVLVRVVRENQNAYFIDYYSQSSNGLDSERELQTEFRCSKVMNDRATIVFAHRPMSQARDSDAVGDVLPGLHAESDGQLRSASGNQRYIQQHAGGAPVEEGGPVMRWVCEQLVAINRGRLAGLADRLTPDQRSMVERANVVGDADLRSVEQLVRLNQRLAHTVENEAHTQYNAAQPDPSSPQYRVGRYAGRHGLLGAWDRRRRTPTRAPLPRSGQMGSPAVRTLAGQRTSGLFRDMPDASRIDWGRCPSAPETASAAGS